LCESDTKHSASARRIKLVRQRLLLFPLLLLAACLGFDSSPKEMLLRSGDVASVRIVEKHWFSGTVIEIAPGKVYSSDENVVTVQGSPGDTSFVVRAMHAGSAYLVAGYPGTNVTAVRVIECPQGTLTPPNAAVATRAGVTVRLQVKATGIDVTRVGWYEEKSSGWVPTPFATGSTYDFTPRASGVYRVQARYDDLCGLVTSTFTITATTRTHAAPH
jgi:hypothetical protein